jgi:cobalt-zinc-cadmium efflux system protein
MVHSHTRSPTRSHTHDSSGSIRLAFFLNLAFSIIELVGGMFTNSIAIMSDALHDFGDSFSLALARYFQKLSQKKRNAHYSYGYRRFSLLGALINALVLLGGSLFIITESVQRLISPQSTDAK